MESVLEILRLTGLPLEEAEYKLSLILQSAGKSHLDLNLEDLKEAMVIHVQELLLELHREINFQ